MNLRQLAYFAKVAETGNITEAAQRLHVSQPSLTKSIRMLEDELGCALFLRLPRGVELTRSGLRLLRHVQVIQQRTEDARRELRSAARGEGVVVRVGAGPAWLRQILPEAVAAFCVEMPAVRVLVSSGFDTVLIGGLKRGDLDFLLAEVPWSSQHEEFEVEPLTRVELRVHARSDHPLAELHRALAVADLMAFPWALPSGATYTRQRLAALFTAQNMPPPEPALESDAMSFLLNFVRCSDALTYAPRHTVEHPDGVGLVQLPASFMDSTRQAGVVRRKSSVLSPEADHLLAIVRRMARARPDT